MQQNNKQQITIELIESKEFKLKARGYDQEEVDTFLDEICDEMERQLNTIARLQQQLKEAQVQKPAAPAAPAAPAPVATAHVAADDFREVLEMAQRVKNETIAEAQRKADAIMSEAQAKVETQLGDLTAERDRLAEEVAELKQAAASYRSRFAQLVAEQQAAMEKAGF